jgi:hypothetical protein
LKKNGVNSLFGKEITDSMVILPALQRDVKLFTLKLFGVVLQVNLKAENGELFGQLPKHPIVASSPFKHAEGDSFYFRMI